MPTFSFYDTSKTKQCVDLPTLPLTEMQKCLTECKKTDLVPSESLWCTTFKYTTNKKIA